MENKINCIKPSLLIGIGGSGAWIIEKLRMKLLKLREPSEGHERLRDADYELKNRNGLFVTRNSDVGKTTVALKFFQTMVNHETVLSTVGLKKSFNGQEVLKDVNLKLQKGDIVLLRGDNGSGKTTLLNILTGNLEPDSGTIDIYANGTPEHFYFPRKWYHNLAHFDHFTPERVSRGGIGRTWQEVRLFSTLNLQENIALAYPGQKGEQPFSAFIRSFNKQECDNIVASGKRLKTLGLAGREKSSADMISLGQSKRTAIGMALQAGAKILFLDEPLAGLDAAGIKDIIEQLKLIAREKQITLVIVEHIFNMLVILEMANKVWTLKNGKITIETPGEVKEEIQISNGSRMQEWINCLGGSEDNPLAIEDSEERLPGGAVLKKFSLSLGNRTVLEVKDLVVNRGNRLVIGEKLLGGDIKGVSFKLCEGELALLEAPNGWGKTTLFEALAGLIPIDKGEIHFYDQDIKMLPSWERVKKGIRFLQARENIFPGLTVKEMLQMAGDKELLNLFPEMA
ncbi:MAG TPA: ATP-binding cassette domain-containing protein, partial [Candidatus Deferrimicrobium sp.]|nr:ATP-binding cassette domain-containing protein [Candidatus Deferrimicrobium sp.]